jgi:hypothetical protein
VTNRPNPLTSVADLSPPPSLLLALQEAQEAQKWDRVSGICSCKVLQVEMDLCERIMKQLSGKPGQEEWADRKEEVEFRMQELAGELEYGVISAKDYLKEVIEKNVVAPPDARL